MLLVIYSTPHKKRLKYVRLMTHHCFVGFTSVCEESPRGGLISSGVVQRTDYQLSAPVRILRVTEKVELWK